LGYFSPVFGALIWQRCTATFNYKVHQKQSPRKKCCICGIYTVYREEFEPQIWHILSQYLA